jgi:predicted PurR-regulated permease PerM
MSPTTPSLQAPASARLFKLLAVALVVGMLYAAQEVFKPLALAILLSFLLALPIRALERRGLRRPFAVSIVTVFAFLVLTSLAWLMTTQLLELARELPGYRQNMLAKVRTVRDSGNGTPLARALDVLTEVGQELSGHAQRHGRGRAAAEPVPAPVTISDESTLDSLSSWIAPLLAPLGSAAAVAVLVVFFLLEREELRNRLIRLAGQSQIVATTQALADAGQRVGRYLLMQLWVNISFGVPLTLGLMAIGIPNALLWGILAVVLRYLPYVGPWLAAFPPLLLSLAIFPDWTHAALTAGLFAVLELLTNQLVEPFAYGSRLGVTPVALIVAALFWTWLWGFVGLVLAAPLTVCLVVLGRSVSHLEFLSILFGDEPALSPPFRLYQRLLAMDPLEAMTLAAQFSGEKGRAELFDGLLLPVLRLEEQDRYRDALSDEHQASVLQALREMVDESAALEAQETGGPPELPKASWVSLPAANEADELAALLLVQLAREQHQVAPVQLSSQRLVQEIAATIKEEGATAVCISTVPPGSVLRARSLCKRLRAASPTLRIVVGLWDGADDERTPASLIEAGADKVVTTLHEALRLLCPESEHKPAADSAGSAGMPAASGMLGMKAAIP